MSTITIEVLTKIKHQYRLSWHGTHGVIHWNRVYENGMKLAEQDGVNRKVLQLFSIFHDSRRRNEHWDRNHGNRGAQLALQLREFWIVLLIPLIWYRSKFNLYHIKGYESSISELSYNESSGSKINQA